MGGLVETYISYKLGNIDYYHPKVQSVTIAIGFAACSIVYFTSLILSRLLTTTYRTLRTPETVFWNLQILRLVYAIFSLVIGVWCFLYGYEEFKEEISSYSMPTTFIALLFSIPHFLFSTFLITASYLTFGATKPLVIFHHWVILINLYLILFNQGSHFFLFLSLLLEVTSPFTAISWVLLKCDKSGSLLWKLNQLVLIVAYLCQFAVLGYTWKEVYSNYNVIQTMMSSSMILSVFAPLILNTFLFTPFSLYKSVKQLQTPPDWYHSARKKKKKSH